MAAQPFALKGPDHVTDVPSIITPNSNRDIDDIIRYVEQRTTGNMSPTIKRVLANRLNIEPTAAELEQAHEELYGTATTTPAIPDRPDHNFTGKREWGLSAPDDRPCTRCGILKKDHPRQ